MPTIEDFTFRFSDLIAGLAGPFRGLAFLRDHRRLRWHAFVPIVLNMVFTLAVLVLLTYAAWTAFQRHGHSLDPYCPTPAFRWIGALLIGTLIVLAVLAATVLSYMVIAVLVCGYWFERLARETERELGHDPSQFSDITFLALASDLVRDFSKLILLSALLLFANVLPIVGSTVAAAGSLVLQWYVLGVEYLSFPMLLRAQRRTVRLAWCRQRFALTVGLGLVNAVFLLIPILNAVLLTGGVVGAVLLYDERRDQ